MLAQMSHRVGGYASHASGDGHEGAGSTRPVGGACNTCRRMGSTSGCFWTWLLFRFSVPAQCIVRARCRQWRFVSALTRCDPQHHDIRRCSFGSKRLERSRTSRRAGLCSCRQPCAFRLGSARDRGVRQVWPLASREPGSRLITSLGGHGCTVRGVSGSIAHRDGLVRGRCVSSGLRPAHGGMC